ncbi:MAG: helix-turn-helix domain-containing protein [Proteobacteria bacterium]|nr:helix-turn-helix domain-containing protein [Pseudomonadota bacterium]
MNYDFTEGTLILALRRLYGYSQIEFCDFLGYSQSTISKIENQTLSPDISFVVSMARKLNIDMNIFKLGFIPKIPTYLLQNKKNAFLNHSYLRDGYFPSKTAYFFLELINQNFKIDAYRAIGIPREYFVFSELKFNLSIFKNILAHVEEKDIIEVLEAAKTKAVPLLAEDSFKDCILDLHMVSIGNILRQENYCDISLDFNFPPGDSPRLNEYYQHVIAFHILQNLNINVKVIRAKKHTADFVLRLYAG